MQRKLFVGTYAEMNAGRYTYNRKRDLNFYRYETEPKRYFNIQIWDGDKISESFMVQARTRYAAKKKANAGGKKVTATLNLKMGVELF